MTQKNTIGATLRLAAAALVLAPALTLQAQAQDKVTVASNSYSLAHGALSLALADPSIFGNNGIELEGRFIQGSSANCIAALLSEEVEMCEVGTTTGNDAVAEGANLKAVAIITGPINEVIISKAAADASGVALDAPIADRAAALKGMRLVTAGPGSPHYISLTTILGEAGLTMDDIQFRTLLDVPAMIESIRNGALDGALWSVGSLAPLLESGEGVRWIMMAKDMPEFSSLPYVTVFARGDWVDANPDLVERIHKSFADSIQVFYDDPDRASKLFKDKFFPDMDPALWEAGFTQAVQTYLPGAKGSAAAWNRFVELQAQFTGKNYDDAAFEKVVIPAARIE